MMLSLHHRFLFVHIAKTGGTSVRAALNRYRWQDPYYLPQLLCSKVSRAFGHRLGVKLPRHAKVIAAREMLPREVFDGLFKFAFVRNPWDLQVSSYHHIRRERPHLLAGHEEFKAFLMWKLSEARPYQYHLDTSMERQTDYLVDLEGNLIVDFVGRYENLGEDFARACRRIGIAPRGLPHRRHARDRERDYRSYYDAETRDLVGSRFLKDIETFGYDF